MLFHVGLEATGAQPLRVRFNNVELVESEMLGQVGAVADGDAVAAAVDERGLQNGRLL